MEAETREAAIPSLASRVETLQLRVAGMREASSAQWEQRDSVHIMLNELRREIGHLRSEQQRTTRRLERMREAQLRHAERPIRLVVTSRDDLEAAAPSALAVDAYRDRLTSSPGGLRDFLRQALRPGRVGVEPAAQHRSTRRPRPPQSPLTLSFAHALSTPRPEDICADDACAVCLEPLRPRTASTAPGEAVSALMACSHQFHEICITKWLSRDLQSPSCPRCRASIPHPAGVLAL